MYSVNIVKITENWKTIPVHGIINGKCTCGKQSCDNQGKHPATTHGVKDAKAGYAIDGLNIGLAHGPDSMSPTEGSFAVDVDDSDQLKRLEMENSRIPKTWSFSTREGRYQLMFKWEPRCSNIKNAVKFCGSLDVRAIGGYSIIPPSKHFRGATYTWINAPDSCELAICPDWLFHLLPKRDEKPTEKPNSKKKYTVVKASSIYDRCVSYLQKCDPAISGQSGHDQAFLVACKIAELFGEKLDDDQLIECLEEWNQRCDPPWTEKELRHKLSEARKKTDTTHNSDTEGDDEDHQSSLRDDHIMEHPIMSPEAFHGLLGEIVRAIEPETEADPAGILLSLLVMCGNVIGRSPHVAIVADTHGCNLFCCLVGDTAAGKGQAQNIGEWFMIRVDPDWYQNCQSRGLTSGEGLIERVQDIDGDSSTKRLLCVETEFARPITAMRREGCTLSSVIRAAWDGKPLEVMTRGKSKLKAFNAFISVLAHITPEELQKLFSDSVETSNGFANRFLWCFVESSKLLPHGGNIDVLTPFVDRLRGCLSHAQSLSRMTHSDSYKRLWETVYAELHASKPGVFGKCTDRARSQVIRLALLFALIDQKTQIEECHLKAALAVWQYCEDSARMLFASETTASSNKKSLDKRILNVVNAEPGIMRSEIVDKISHHLKKEQYDAAFKKLLHSKKIVLVSVFEGRQAECYYPAVDSSVGKEGNRETGKQCCIATIKFPFRRQLEFPL